MDKQPAPGRRARAPNEPGERCRLDLTRFVPYRISVVSALIRRALAEIYRSDPGLSEPEWKVMTTLAHYGPLASGDVGHFVTLDRVAVSRALQRLIARGLATRRAHRHDQRMFTVELTPEAASRYDRMARQALAIEGRILERLEPGEVDELLRLLAQVEACFLDHSDRRRSSLIQAASAFIEGEAAKDEAAPVPAKKRAAPKRRPAAGKPAASSKG